LLIFESFGGCIRLIGGIECSAFFTFDKNDGCDGGAPSKINRKPDAVRTRDVIPDSLSVDVAAYVPQISERGKGELQCILLMDENSSAIPDKLKSRTEANNECRRRGIRALTLIGLATTATLAGMTLLARRVNGARGARLTKEAGRDKRGLMLAINRDQWSWQLFILTGVEHGQRLGGQHFHGDNP
jgi:hypothetical protein